MLHMHKLFLKKITQLLSE